MRFDQELNEHISDPMDLFDPEKRLEFFSRTASETSTTTTCKSAYMFDRNRFIESGHVLDGNYLMTRFAILSVQLTRSAIRLAKLIETMAWAWKERKQSVTWTMRTDIMNKAAVVPPPSPPPIHTNRFVVLEMDELVMALIFGPLFCIIFLIQCW